MQFPQDQFSAMNAEQLLDAICSLGAAAKSAQKAANKKADSGKGGFEQLANEFVDYLSANKRYPLFFKGVFYLWDGTRYVRENGLSYLLRQWLKASNKPQNNHIVSNVLNIVQSMAYKSEAQYGAMPFYAGSEAFPKAENLIAFNNGLLDLTRFADGERNLIPHTPQWFSTICLPYGFDPAATCPQFLAFLEAIFGNDQSRKTMLQEWMGYLLAGDISQHKMLLQWGPPRAGKSLLMSIMAGLVGSDYSTGFSLYRLIDRFSLRSLVDKRVAFIGEVNLSQCREKYRILENLNSLIGGDALPIEEKGVALTESLVLSTRIVVSCNEMPKFVDPSGALAPRLLILEFTRSFEGREDRGLKDRLLTELPGICNWALEGLLRLREQGRFTESSRMQSLVNDFRRSGSDALAFAQDCLIVESRLNPGNLHGVTLSDSPLEVDRHALVSKYEQWCEETGTPNKGDLIFADLKGLLKGLEYKRNRTRKCYIGIALKPETDAEPVASESDPVPQPSRPADETLTDAEWDAEIRAM